VELGTTALKAGQDVELRRELAAWLESLGEPAEAAAALKPIASLAEVDSADAADVLVRVGVLRARAGVAAAAASAFEAALSVDGADALAGEFLGALSSWQPGVVPASAAIEAYLESAHRRAARGQDDAELLDLWRAFEADPSSDVAARSLAAALEQRTRPSAADEVLRIHAQALAPSDPIRAACVHARRRTSALAAREPVRAFAAAIDEGLAGQVDGEGSEAFDALLKELGVLEAVAARLDARAGGPPFSNERGSQTADSPAAAWIRAAAAGDARGQALSLERLASSQSGPVRAAVLAAASACHLAVGDAAVARIDAELAARTDPRSARSVAALADAVSALSGDPGAAVAIERAIAMVGPRVVWCSALADALDAGGETELAAGWSQRSVAIRPGERGAIEALLRRLLRAEDSSRLRDALAWLLGQPQPAAWAAPPFAKALTELARVDSERAGVVARRALEVFGPKLAALREAMLGVAERTSDHAFAVAILERTLSCRQAEDVDRAALFARLAKLRLQLGDDEGVARITWRALSEGLPEPGVDPYVVSSCGTTPDAELWRLRANAARLSAAGDPAAAARACRDLGAAIWDLAEDRAGAIDAWLRAARMTPGGYATLAFDLATFWGAAFAFDYLGRAVDAESDDATATSVASEASRAALAVGEPMAAFNLASRGVARSPASTEALEAAEIAAPAAGEDAGLSALYDLVASKAMGRFGRRAAHYRAARHFERAGLHTPALKHAAQAFLAVPSEGPTLQSLARTAERAGDRLLAVRTVEQVAEREESAIARSGWLRRAASIAGDGEDGVRRKVDILLRAFSTAPSLSAVSLLAAASRELLRFGPEERDGLELRLGHAARSSGAQLEGPEGARVAIAFAVTLLDLFGDSEGAFALVERAFACDGGVDDFARLAAWAPALAQVNGARNRVAAIVATTEGPHANAGISALRLLAAMAASAGDDSLRARASIAAALRAPEDDGLVIEADDALRTLTRSGMPSPDGTERVVESIGPDRRATALAGAARARVAAGGFGDAAVLFERAVDLLGPSASSEVERELRAALDAAGRGSEIEARALREATAESGAPVARADAWTQVAELREMRGNAAAAAQALREACRLDPEPLARWSALERVAELAEDDEARVEALERILNRVGDDGRANVLKRLANAHERRGDLEAAERTWRRVLELDPEDEKGDQAIQSLIVTRGDYETLVEHLAQRAARLSARPDHRELLRAVRLRRAAILEQRLGRTADACAELELLLQEWPDSVVAIRYLADLFDRQANFVRSVPLWRQAAALEDSDSVELRAARASHAAGDLVAAHEHAGRVLSRSPAVDNSAPASRRWGERLDEALALRVDAARALGADADLGDALDAMASKPSHDASMRTELLLESARAAARAGDLSRGLDRAKRAEEAMPERAEPRLLSCAIEYRIRGAGDPSEARSSVEYLNRIREPLARDDTALRAFLLAESLDVIQGGGAGLRELEGARAAIGDHPLLALGVAERLAAQGQYEAATDAYRQALSGPLLELRREAVVALAAAEVAVQAGRNTVAASFIEMAEKHEETRAGAGALRERLRAPQASVESAADVRLYDLEAAVHQATSQAARAYARLALARGRLDFGDVRGAEPLLWEALADGLAEAGDLLAPILASSPDRAPELVRVRWQQVALEPGDVERLDSLRAAALADDDRVHARAVEHVLRAFEGASDALVPPPLMVQPEQPGILALLSRPSLDAAGEALALLWEGAMQLFVRDAASYGITGVERVEPGPSSAVSRIYEAAVRVLDVPRVPLFVIRSQASPVHSRAALLSPPSVILAGDVQIETAELRFELGRGLSAALPHHVLRQALPDVEGRAVVEALRTAFGTPELGRQVDTRVARLAESFWQIIPASAQRRLQELLRAATLADREELVEASLQSGRRIGMFLAGDFACAARILLAESAVRDVTTAMPPSLENLRELCLAVPALADLLRLAVRSEYADARWHAPGSASPRRGLSSGRFNPF
jgi:tetratricopeptide (TPR) repeat protein